MFFVALSKNQKTIEVEFILEGIEVQCEANLKQVTSDIVKLSQENIFLETSENFVFPKYVENLNNQGRAPSVVLADTELKITDQQYATLEDRSLNETDMQFIERHVDNPSNYAKFQKLIATGRWGNSIDTPHMKEFQNVHLNVPV